jgi:hypothetical protein
MLINMENIVSSPPILPGDRATRIIDIPPKTPALPAIAKTDSARSAEIARRRAALAGSGIGDPASTRELLVMGGKNALKQFRFIKKILVGRPGPGRTMVFPDDLRPYHVGVRNPP